MRLPRNGVRGILIEEFVNLGQSESVTYLQVTDDQHLSRRLKRVIGINFVLNANLFIAQGQ